jgi:predicted RecB family nuclease
MKITPAVFEAYLKCPTKCWLRATGEAASGNTYAEWVQAQNASYRETGTARLIAASPEDEVARSPDMETVKAATWRLASSLAVLAEMDSCALESELHAVERVPAGGRGKAAQFIPIRFVFTNKLGKDDKLLLALDAVALSKALKREVSLSKIIHGDNHATLKVKTSALAGEVRKRLEKIAALLANSTPPDLFLNRHCGECEFQSRCRKIAIEKDDLSLLANMSAKERQKLRSKGIFTVTQLSYTFRPRRRAKKLRDKREKYHHSLKALAIREKKIHIVGNPELKIEGTPVYLDVEGIPDRDFYYLIGLRIGHGDSAVQHSLWADTAADEGKIWREFLAILETVEKPVLIHYGSYETNFSKEMAERHGSPQADSGAAKAIASALNLVSVMFAKIYFPTYSNSLKEIAQHLKFEWSEVDSSGTSSIAWRQNWERLGSAFLMQTLITYNAEDCMALARLNGRVGALSIIDRKINSSIDVVHADSLPRSFPCTFKLNQFQFAEFEQINQAAYWDYQREKVLVKSSDRLKRIARTARTRKTLKPRVNKTVEWPGPETCPKCGEAKIYKHQTARKTVVDVQFGLASLKRWVTKYLFHRYKCTACRAVFYNSECAWSGEKFGPNLRAFCVYQNIELRLPQKRIAEFLNLLLGFDLSRGKVNLFKASAATFYESTYKALLESIVAGSLVHADETKVNIDAQSGYVWVLTNLEAAVYIYAPTREGDLIHQVLKDFQGVVVSDFYAPYDSLSCPQQKCLIHLIPKTVENRTRNGNGKAWQNDFDLENLSWPGNWKS